MNRAYLVLECTVHDAELYSQYTALSPQIVDRYGGCFLVRGGQIEVREGQAPAPRVVIIDFPSMQQLRLFYDSEDYQRILPTRQAATTSRLFFVEGHHTDAGDRDVDGRG